MVMDFMGGTDDKDSPCVDRGKLLMDCEVCGKSISYLEVRSCTTPGGYRIELVCKECCVQCERSISKIQGLTLEQLTDLLLRVIPCHLKRDTGEIGTVPLADLMPGQVCEMWAYAGRHYCFIATDACAEWDRLQDQKEC